MSKTWHLLVPAAALLNVFATCQPRLYTPPVRLWTQESPAPLAEGENAVSFFGGGHLGVYMGFDEFRAASGAMTYRRGLTDLLELQGQASLLSVSPRSSAPDVGTRSPGLRLGLKFSPKPLRRVLSLRGGAGIGFSEAGEYAGADLGVSFGYENPYCTPFLNGGVYISQPFNTRMVFFGTGEADIAERSMGFDGGLGLKFLPVRSARNGGRAPFDVATYGVGAWTMVTSPHHDPIWPLSVGGGVEVVF
jgi:hypothetical protein